MLLQTSRVFVWFFFHLLPTPSLSSRISKGCQLINSSLPAHGASNNMLGASRDSNPGPLEVPAVYTSLLHMGLEFCFCMKPVG